MPFQYIDLVYIVVPTIIFHKIFSYFRVAQKSTGTDFAVNMFVLGSCLFVCLEPAYAIAERLLGKYEFIRLSYYSLKAIHTVAPKTAFNAVVATILSIIIGIIYSFLNERGWLEKILKFIGVKSLGNLETHAKFINELIGTSNGAVVSLKNNKLYIGPILSHTTNPNFNHSSIVIIPMISCTRTDGGIRFDASYYREDDAISDFAKDIKHKMVISWSEISSIAAFDPKLLHFMDDTPSNEIRDTASDQT